MDKHVCRGDDSSGRIAPASDDVPTPYRDRRLFGAATSAHDRAASRRLPHGGPAGFAARELGASHPRAPSRARVGRRRDLELHARRVRALLLQPEGRAGAGALRVFPPSGAVRRFHAARRARGRGARDGVDLRGARRIPAQRRQRAPRRTRRAVREIRAAEGAARGRRLVRAGAQAAAARVSARGRHRDLDARRRAARPAHDAEAALAGARGHRLSRRRCRATAPRNRSRRRSAPPTRAPKSMC